jgi:hypothetical protein
MPAEFEGRQESVAVGVEVEPDAFEEFVERCG